MPKQYSSSSKMSRDNLRDYKQARQQNYPTTYQDKHPSAQVQKDYNTYKARAKEANASVDQYWDSYESHTGDREIPIETLSKRQHGSLVYPAAEAANDTLMHARARGDFLRKHPYGYQTGQRRRKHEKLSDSAFGDASYYRGRYDIHLSGSKSLSSGQKSKEDNDYRAPTRARDKPAGCSREPAKSPRAPNKEMLDAKNPQS